MITRIDGGPATRGRAGTVSVEFKLPELGENIEAGDVVRVLVSAGDVVAAEQAVIELETDKATIEVPSPAAGTVESVAVRAGDRVAVGQLVLTLAETADGGASTGTATATTPVTRVPTPPGRSEARAERRQGKGLRSDRVPEESPVASTRGEVVAIRPTLPPAATERPPGAPAAPAAPSVRRLAREIGVDIDQVRGTGPGGRISAADVKAFSRSLVQAGRARSSAGTARPPLPDLARWGEIEREPMSGIRRKTASHLSAAWTTIPHVTQHDAADVTDLEALRARFADAVEAKGGKLTVTAIAIKVVASALRVFPQFNASVDLDSEEIVRKHYVHVGVAVDTQRGLLVPVIRDADRKNIAELSVELGALAERARAGTLTLDEMSGGCFTITNLGGIGGSFFTPIVNWPEVAILGISRAATEPVYVGGDLRPRLRLPLSLSYDHRVIDGADGIRFLRWVVEALEQPFLLSLEG